MEAYHCCSCGFGPMLTNLYASCIMCGEHRCEGCAVATVERDKSPKTPLELATPQDQGLNQPGGPPVDMTNFEPSQGMPHLSALLEEKEIAVNLEALVTQTMGRTVEAPVSSVTQQGIQSTQQGTPSTREAGSSPPASVQNIVRRIVDEHQAGNLTRKWLVKTFPAHFEGHRKRLRKSSTLQSYGPEKLGIDQTLWSYLTGDDGS